jgi:hypothetical protein
VNPRLNESEAQLKEKAQRICAEAVGPEAVSVDAEVSFPAASLQAIADAGLLGVCLPGEYGGAGGGAMELVLVLEEVGRVSASLGAVLVHHMGIVGRTLAAHGTDAQKETLLPDLIAGKRVAGLASLARGATATMLAAGVAMGGSEGDETLDGTLPAVTGATIAGLFLVPAVSYEPQPEGVSTGALFLVDRNSEGLSVGEEEVKLGLNGSGIAAMTLAEVRVGAEDRLPADACGPGMLRRLTDAANLGYAAVAVGIAQAALDAALDFLAGSDDECHGD